MQQKCKPRVYLSAVANQTKIWLSMTRSLVLKNTIPQVSVLFLVYVKDFSRYMSSECRLCLRHNCQHSYQKSQIMGDQIEFSINII